MGQKQAAVLIVFDNFSETGALESWLPVGVNLKALVTTRRRDLNYPKVSLPFLTQKEGLELLNNGERRFGLEAFSLIDALGGLPLALELTCNFLNRRPTLNIDNLLLEMTKLGQLSVLDEFTKQYRNELPTNHEKAIGATFQLSWDLASKTGQRLLKLMACLAPSPIPRRLLKNTLDDNYNSTVMSEADNGISELERLSLIDLDENHDPKMHRLLRGFANAQIHQDEAEIKRQAVEVVKMELSRTQDQMDTAALRELESVIPHGQSVLDEKIADQDQAIDIANSISWHHSNRGRYQLAKEFGQRALDLAKQSYEPGHPSIARRQSNLAMVLKDLGDLEGAKALLIKSYKIFVNALGENHYNTLKIKGNLDAVETEINVR